MKPDQDETKIADATFRIDTMPPEGRDIALAVGEEDRERIARQLDISAVEQLSVALHAVKFRGGMRVTGTVGAVVVQPSVVTLDPVRQQIDEPVDRVFLPAGSVSAKAAAAGAEIFVDLESDDIPDHFEGHEADMSALIIETLALALDPYPRATGESLEALDVAPAEPEESPFAALRRLGKGEGEG